MTDAVFGEPHAAVFVEHDVVWSTQLVTIAVRVEVGDFARVQINSLNSSAYIKVGIEWPRVGDAVVSAF